MRDFVVLLLFIVAVISVSVLVGGTDARQIRVANIVTAGAPDPDEAPPICMGKPCIPFY